MIDDVFSYNHYLSREETEMLATKLGLSTNQVFGIFQRKRSKLKAQGFNSNSTGRTKVFYFIKQHAIAC